MELNWSQFSQRTFYREKQLVSNTFSVLEKSLFRREIGSITSVIILVIFKIRIKKNKAEEGIDLKLMQRLIFGSKHYVLND